MAISPAVTSDTTLASFPEQTRSKDGLEYLRYDKAEAVAPKALLDKISKLPEFRKWVFTPGAMTYVALWERDKERIPAGSTYYKIKNSGSDFCMTVRAEGKKIVGYRVDKWKNTDETSIEGTPIPKFIFKKGLLV